MNVLFWANSSGSHLHPPNNGTTAPVWLLLRRPQSQGYNTGVICVVFSTGDWFIYLNSGIQHIVSYFVQFGFSLDRTRNDAVNPYLENHQDVCLLQDWTHPEPNSETIYFRLNLRKKLWVACWENENACLRYLMWKIHSSELLHHSKIQKTEESGSAVFVHE
jgi:hypothetical protein